LLCNHHTDRFLINLCAIAWQTAHLTCHRHLFRDPYLHLHSSLYFLTLQNLSRQNKFSKVARCCIFTHNLKLLFHLNRLCTIPWSLSLRFKVCDSLITLIIYLNLKLYVNGLLTLRIYKKIFKNESN
jgi:hypothetical protein